MTVNKKLARQNQVTRKPLKGPQSLQKGGDYQIGDMLAVVTIYTKLTDQRQVEIKENPLKKVSCPQERNRDCPAEFQMFTVNRVIVKPLKEQHAHPKRTGDYLT